MGREWCVLITPREDALETDVAYAKDVLTAHEPGFDLEEDEEDGTLRVFVDQPHNPRRTAKAIMHALAQHGVADCIQRPLRVGHWNDHKDCYVFRDYSGEPEPAVPFDAIAWAVAVHPASAFDWRETRAELKRLGRTTIRETARAIEVGARDEQDAEALRRSLSAVACVGEMKARPLTWLQRWRVRERLLGNYAAGDDLTQPY